MERDLTHPLQPGAENTTRIDLDQMTDAIWEEMRGRIEKRVIHRALEEILPGYLDARIQGFVPILMRRDLTEMLTEGKLPA